VSRPAVDWSALRLRDRIAPDLRVLFVGINPGVRSATTGHHFAGFSNRFWRLLVESRLVPEPITFVDDRRLLEWGLGITNLIARPSPGIDDLRPAEYVGGWKTLERKIAKYRPATVALVGVTLYRAILPHLPASSARAVGPPAGRAPRSARPAPVLGLRPETIHGARLFVVPNPSGRNANFSYAEMLAIYRALARYARN
jgi:double-stranded uracil-DNA glycosylase